MEYIYFENLKCCYVLNVVWHYISIRVSIALHDRLSFRLNASRHYKRVCNSDWEFSTEQVLAVTQLLPPVGRAASALTQTN